MTITLFLLLCFISGSIGYRAFWYIKYTKEESNQPSKGNDAQKGEKKPEPLDHPPAPRPHIPQKKNANSEKHKANKRRKNRIKNRMAKKSRQVNRR